MEPNTDSTNEQSIFNESDFSMEGYDKHIRNARILLFVVAGMTLISLWSLAPFDNLASQVGAGVVVLIAGVFVLLAFWTKKKPYTAILTALIFYILLVVLSAIVQPASLFQGWIFKIALIVLLILGLRNGKQSQDMMEAFGKKK